MWITAMGSASSETTRNPGWRNRPKAFLNASFSALGLGGVLGRRKTQYNPYRIDSAPETRSESAMRAVSTAGLPVPSQIAGNAAAATAHPMVPKVRIGGNCLAGSDRFWNATLLVSDSVGMYRTEY